jgi:hypothetical protein
MNDNIVGISIIYIDIFHGNAIFLVKEFNGIPHLI